MALTDEPRLITRDETAAILGVSLQEVKRKQAVKQLRVAKRAGKNTVLYNYDEVMAMKMRRDDDRAAVVGNATAMSFTAEEAKLVCAELRIGASLLDCLEKLTIHPAKIRAILCEYEAMSGGVFLDASIVAAINELPLDGTFPVTKASDILALLSGKSGAPSCCLCKKRASQLCKACSIPYVRKQLQAEEAQEG